MDKQVLWRLGHEPKAGSLARGLWRLSKILWRFLFRSLVIYLYHEAGTWQSHALFMGPSSSSWSSLGPGFFVSRSFSHSASMNGGKASQVTPDIHLIVPPLWLDAPQSQPKRIKLNLSGGRAASEHWLDSKIPHLNILAFIGISRGKEMGCGERGEERASMPVPQHYGFCSLRTPVIEDNQPSHQISGSPPQRKLVQVQVVKGIISLLCDSDSVRVKLHPGGALLSPLQSAQPFPQKIRCLNINQRLFYQ